MHHDGSVVSTFLLLQPVDQLLHLQAGIIIMTSIMMSVIDSHINTKKEFSFIFFRILTKANQYIPLWIELTKLLSTSLEVALSTNLD